MLTIKVLGPGCANCKRLEEIARKAASDANIEAQFVKVTDTDEILAYNILSTPGLVINEKLMSSGRIPSPGVITGWLKEAAAGA